MDSDDSLTMWVITCRPKDYPDEYVARRWLVFNHGPTPASGDTGDVLVSDTLDGVRDQLPPGLHNIGRQGNDHPVIVEVWV